MENKNKLWSKSFMAILFFKEYLNYITTLTKQNKN